MATETKELWKWQVQTGTDAYTFIVRDSAGRMVASTPQGESERNRANVRLIAAAPKMLEALKEISHRDPVGGTCSHDCTCIGCIARDAIFKAEGK